MSDQASSKFNIPPQVANLLAILGLILTVIGVVIWIFTQNSGGVEIVKPTPQPIIVHILGEVNSPGVYDLPKHSRVQDLISAADGTTTDADLTNLNLAQILTDGQQITVKAVVIPTPLPLVRNQEPMSVQPVTESTPVTTPANESMDLIDLNTATQQELDTLPGIGPALAAEIVKWRENRGTIIQTTDELTQVSGIGKATVEKIREFVLQE